MTQVQVGALRMTLEPRDEQELRWYFTSARNEVLALGGLRSNVGPILDYLELGARIQASCKTPDGVNDGVFAIAARMRPIERTLARMPREAVRVLRRIFANDVPDDLRRPIGVEAVCLSREEQVEARAAVAQKDHARIVVLRRKAHAAHAWALEEWRQAKPARRREEANNGRV